MFNTIMKPVIIVKAHPHTFTNFLIGSILLFEVLEKVIVALATDCCGSASFSLLAVELSWQIMSDSSVLPDGVKEEGCGTSSFS